MKLRLSNFFVLLGLIFLAQNFSAQVPSEYTAPVKATFTGIVLDAANNLPLGYATVSLFAKKDSSLLGGGLTNDVGSFSFEAKVTPSYAVVDFLGYENKIIDPVPYDMSQIRRGNRSINLGTIKLTQGGILVEEVEIRAERSETQFTLDKRVFNVGKDLANRGGTAEEILDNVPSVTVDIEGQVSLRGSTGVQILVDGKPSRFASGDNANSLRQIPADMIEKIEVITNPSSRYEAEGMAGIINIVLKKDKRSGFNGSFNGSVGFPYSSGVGASVNYRKNKLNWFATYGLNYRSNVGGGGLYQEVYGLDTTFITDQNRDNFRGGLSNSIRAGLDYFFTEKESFTASLQYRISSEDNGGELIFNDYLNSFDQAGFIGSTRRSDDEREEESGLQYQLNYRKQFSTREHFLDITAQYEDDLEAESSAFLTQFTSPEGVVSDFNDQRSANDEGQKNWLFQLDYNHPFSKDHKYEFGLRASLRDISNLYKVEEEIEEGVWMTLDQFSDNFIYNEDIYAAYFQYGNKLGRFNFQGGLRGEYSDVTTELVESDTVNARTYMNLFPSAFINYEITQGNAFQLSYSRRIRRPRFWDLNPFFTFSDNRNLFSGNPNIDPEFTDSYEFNYLRIWDQATFTTGVFYRFTRDPISRIRQVNIDGINTVSPVNLLYREDYGLETTMAYSGVKWLRVDGTINVFRNTIDGSNVGQEFRADSYTMDGRLTTRITALSGTDFQIRGNYRAPRANPQGRTKAIGSIDIGISRDFLPQKNLSLTLSIRDLLNSRRRRYITEGDHFYAEGDFQWRGRTIRLSASYRINQQNRKNRRGGGDWQGGEGDFEGGGF